MANNAPNLKRKTPGNPKAVGQAPKKPKVAPPFSTLPNRPPPPTTGTETYKIKSSGDWHKWISDNYHADVRPATSIVSVRYKTATKPKGDYLFGISNREEPKDDSNKVKLNPFLIHPKYDDIYYSKSHPKFIAKNKRQKVALDDISATHESGYSKDILRVLKGKAHSKGLESAEPKRALLAGGLISTSERGRSLFNPINAHIELYKVKHGKRKLEDVFHPTTGTFIAGRKGGAEASRKQVTNDFLSNAIQDKAMKKIYDTRVKATTGAKHAKHGSKSFEEWVGHKANKWQAYYPITKKP